MADDRRKPLDRRGDSESTDRRKKVDRRTAAGRRKGADGGVNRSSGRKKSSSRKKSSKQFDWSSFFKKVAAAFVIFTSVFMLVVVYFFAHLDHHMQKVSQRIDVSLEKAYFDPESITDRSTGARLNLGFKNSLPLEVVIQNIFYNVHLGGYTVAKGMQYSPKLSVKGGDAGVLALKCGVDSIMTRRGLQKVKINGRAGRDYKLGHNYSSVVRLDGRVDCRLKAAGLEIPFSFELDIGGR